MGVTTAKEAGESELNGRRSDPAEQWFQDPKFNPDILPLEPAPLYLWFNVNSSRQWEFLTTRSNLLSFLKNQYSKLSFVLILKIALRQDQNSLL